MRNPSKPIVAATNNLAALGIGGKEARTHGENYAWTLDGVNHIVIFHAPHRRSAKQFLESAGAVTIPHHAGPGEVGEAFAALCPTSAGVLATDTSWVALQKIASVAGVMFDPEEL